VAKKAKAKEFVVSVTEGHQLEFKKVVFEIEVHVERVKGGLTPPTRDAHAKLDKVAIELFLFWCCLKA